jgi:ubiquinone/menaquinone biosynthesis C-methylase UbiE
VNPFDQPYPLENGIVRALAKRPKLPPAQASNFLLPTAALYELLWRKRSLGIITGGRVTTEQELTTLLKAVQPQAGERILDAACSAGLYARTLKSHLPDLDVHALDMSLPFLQRAQSYAQRDALKLTLVEADVHRLPYQEASFNVVVCGGSLNEFLDIPQVLGEFARVLKPQGRLWLMYVTPSQGVVGQAIQRLLQFGGIQFIDPDTLQSQAVVAGLYPQFSEQHSVIRLELYTKSRSQ